MAESGPRVPSAAHPVGTITSPSSPKLILTLEQQLQAWEPEIIRAAKAWGLSYDATQDLVQMARIRLARALGKRSDLSERYIRVVIANAMRKARKLTSFVDEPVDLAVNDDSTAPEAEDARPIASERFQDAEYVRHWLVGLPVRLQMVFETLYVKDMTQRAAAKVLGVSQPRIAQLNAELIRRGRNDLVALAA